jgi:hypothetical protein
MQIEATKAVTIKIFLLKIKKIEIFIICISH